VERRRRREERGGCANERLTKFRNGYPRLHSLLVIGGLQTGTEKKKTEKPFLL
jgi:hypothetical protein